MNCVPEVSSPSCGFSHAVHGAALHAARSVWLQLAGVCCWCHCLSSPSNPPVLLRICGALLSVPLQFSFRVACCWRLLARLGGLCSAEPLSHTHPSARPPSPCVAGPSCSHANRRPRSYQTRSSSSWSVGMRPGESLTPCVACLASLSALAPTLPCTAPAHVHACLPIPRPTCCPLPSVQLMRDVQ